MVDTDDTDDNVIHQLILLLFAFKRNELKLEIGWPKKLIYRFATLGCMIKLALLESMLPRVCENYFL